VPLKLEDAYQIDLYVATSRKMMLKRQIVEDMRQLTAQREEEAR
jgi:hypothetical protein